MVLPERSRKGPTYSTGDEKRAARGDAVLRGNGATDVLFPGPQTPERARDTGRTVKSLLLLRTSNTVCTGQGRQTRAYELRLFFRLNTEISLRVRNMYVGLCRLLQRRTVPIRKKSLAACRREVFTRSARRCRIPRGRGGGGGGGEIVSRAPWGKRSEENATTNRRSVGGGGRLTVTLGADDVEVGPPVNRP